MTKITETDFVLKAAEPLAHQHARITMNRVLGTGGPGFFGRFANVLLLAAARNARSMKERPTRVTEEPATMDIREVQPSRGTPIVAADLDFHAERLDAVAGSEFVDDRIRLRD